MHLLLFKWTASDAINLFLESPYGWVGALQNCSTKKKIYLSATRLNKDNSNWNQTHTKKYKLICTTVL